MNFLGTDVKAEYFSRFGRALRANRMIPNKSAASPGRTASKDPVKLLTHDQIEAKLQSIGSRLTASSTSPCPSSLSSRQSPFFLAISREQRNKLDKLTSLETPSPVHYTPQFAFVQTRSVSTKLVASRTKAKPRQVPLPGCVDGETLDCTRRGRTEISPVKGMLEDTYLSLLQDREERRSTPKAVPTHIPCFHFHKQLKRTGIPLNPNYESHFQSKLPADKVSAPSFHKSLPRTHIFDPSEVHGAVYDYEVETVMPRIDTGAVCFGKMSPRIELKLGENLVESPELSKLDAALLSVKPRTHIPVPDIGKLLAREDLWATSSKEPPKRRHHFAEIKRSEP